MFGTGTVSMSWKATKHGIWIHEPVHVWNGNSNYGMEVYKTWNMNPWAISCLEVQERYIWYGRLWNMGMNPWASSCLEQEQYLWNGGLQNMEYDPSSSSCLEQEQYLWYGRLCNMGNDPWGITCLKQEQYLWYRRPKTWNMSPWASSCWIYCRCCYRSKRVNRVESNWKMIDKLIIFTKR